MRPLLALVFSFLFTQISLVAKQEICKESVSATLQELLSLHVEHQKLDSTLYARSLKIFIEQFDQNKTYFLANEVKNMLQLSQKELERGIQNLYEQNLSDFEFLSSQIEKAIDRARKWRREIEKELILSTLHLKPIRGESYLSYPTDEELLNERIKNHLIRILFEEKQAHQMEEWTPKDREQIFQLWERRFERKEKNYLENREAREYFLALHSLRALAKSLDAHTAYFSPEEAREMRAALEKQFEGIGIILREGIYGIFIEALIPGGPADRSGKVLVGDRIVHVNGENTQNKTYEDVLKALQGKGEKGVRLGLQRGNGSKLEEVYVERKKIKMSEGRVQYSSYPFEEGHIGLINLPSFYEGGQGSSAESDLREAIKNLKKKGSLQGLIIDLRENAGGFLSQAVKIAALFVTKGVIVISKYSKGEIKYLRNLDGKLFYEGPVILLTSRASASAAEIVAQALQDYGVALVVGDEETYGKGTIQYQTITDKEAKNFYKVTVGRYYTVSGRSTQIEGVKADVVVPTLFSFYKIGERFLDYPLSADQVPAAYVDPLTDIDYRSRIWFQKNYLPNLHQPADRLRKILPTLKKNSAWRLSHHKNFVEFLEMQNKIKGKSPRGFQRITNPPWGESDLQMEEAIEIMKDILYLQENRLSDIS